MSDERNEIELKKLHQAMTHYAQMLMFGSPDILDVAIIINWNTPEKNANNPTSGLFSNRPHQDITPLQAIELSEHFLSVMRQCFINAHTHLAKQQVELLKGQVDGQNPQNESETKTESTAENKVEAGSEETSQT